MRNLWKGGLAILGAIAISTVGVTEALAQQTFGWAPKPAQLAPYVGGNNQPHTKLTDVLAGKPTTETWHHQIVTEPNVSAKWVGMKVGDATRSVLSADHKVAFIVWDGTVQVEIQGVATFTATKGFMINVPFRREYKLTNIGSVPSLHFEIYAPDRVALYPENAQTLPPPPQFESWHLSRLDGPGAYGTGQNAIFRNFTAAPFNGAFVSDDRLFVNAIRGSSSSLPPATDVGHYHSYGEFWFIIEGTLGYLIEGLPYFTATPGDVVYAAPGRWHRAGFHPGAGTGTRVAINGYPRGAHLWPQTNPPATPPVQATAMAPSTRATLSPVTSSGSYLQPTVTLSGYPNANSLSDDLDYSEYWLDGAPAPTRYTGPFKINGNGLHTLMYRSVDKAGNVEEPKSLSVGVIDLPPLTLQVVPSILNLRTAGLVTTVLTVPAGYDLRQWGVADIRAGGAPAVSAAYSADGRTIVATFNKAAFGNVPAGNEVRITVTGQFNYDGAQAGLAASTLVRVVR